MSRDNLIRPSDKADEPSFVSRLFDMLEQILKGRTRNVGEVTLTENATTTAVDNPLFESHQTIHFTAMTADAAAEIAAGAFHVSSRGSKQFTITHANDASTTRTFSYTFTG